MSVTICLKKFAGRLRKSHIYVIKSGELIPKSKTSWPKEVMETCLGERKSFLIRIILFSFGGHLTKWGVKKKNVIVQIWRRQTLRAQKPDSQTLRLERVKINQHEIFSKTPYSPRVTAVTIICLNVIEHRLDTWMRNNEKGPFVNRVRFARNQANAHPSLAVLWRWVGFSEG